MRVAVGGGATAILFIAIAIIGDSFHILQGHGHWLLVAEVPAILLVSQAAGRSGAGKRPLGLALQWPLGERETTGRHMATELRTDSVCPGNKPKIVISCKTPTP